MCAECDRMEAEEDARMNTGTTLDVARARYAAFVAGHFTGERRADTAMSDWATARLLLVLAKTNPTARVTLEKSRAD